MAVTLLIGISYVVIAFTVAFLLLYAVRHYLLGYSRLRIDHPKDSMELVGFYMPRVTVLIPMHNEERVAADVLQAIVDSDYDWEKLEVIPVNDRSTDKTREIVEREFAKKRENFLRLSDSEIARAFSASQAICAAKASVDTVMSWRRGPML